jgi:hypothetical protein
MCDCIARIDQDLSSEDQCLDATMFGERKASPAAFRALAGRISRARLVAPQECRDV